MVPPLSEVLVAAALVGAVVGVEAEPVVVELLPQAATKASNPKSISENSAITGAVCFDVLKMLCMVFSSFSEDGYVVAVVATDVSRYLEETTMRCYKFQAKIPKKALDF